MGFSLFELLISFSLGLLAAAASHSLLLQHLNTSEKIENLEQQRNNWSRTSGFIDAELALSERVIDNANHISIPQGCNISTTEFRLALDLRRDLPLVIYGVRAAGQGWHGNNVLLRCGPSLNDDGSYNSSLTSDVIIDGLDGNSASGGFAAQAVNNKLARYTLAIQGKTAKTLQPLMNAHTRISPLYTRPSNLNLCGAANLVKLSGSSGANLIAIDVGQVNAGEDILICGLGGGDTIKGSYANDILECGSSSETDTTDCTLWGGDGNDVLRGGHGNDILHADQLSDSDSKDTSSNNTLIGGKGQDAMHGGDGKNQYLPGEGNDTVYGGNGLDIVFYDGNKENYSISNCTKAECLVSSNTEGSDTLKSVEILIFKDARFDPP